MTKERNDVVIIELDRPRELRFGHKALKKMLALTGMTLQTMDINNFDFETIEKVMFCGLLADDKDLKLEDMEDLLDEAPLGVIIDKMTEALDKAFGEQVEEAKNLQKVASK